jgi:hypothetical protein
LKVRKKLYTGHLFSFKKWHRHIKKNALFANDTLMGRLFCKISACGFEEFYAGQKNFLMRVIAE